jgi:hypothetical protein
MSSKQNGAGMYYYSLERNITWVRTAKNFLENIEYQSETRPRFKLVKG